MVEGGDIIIYLYNYCFLDKYLFNKYYVLSISLRVEKRLIVCEEINYYFSFNEFIFWENGYECFC